LNRWLHLTIIFASASFIDSQRAFGQRGQSYGGHAKPWSANTQGFPGYFDSNMAEENSLVVEFPPMLLGIVPTPFIAVDYGVTETLTVGTNAAWTVLPYLFGAKSLSVKARTLLIGDQSEQASATYYGGVISIPTDTSLNAYYHILTWNHAWRIASSHTLSAHGNLIRMNLEQGTIRDLNHAQLNFDAMMLGAGYGYEFNERWSLRGNGIITAYQSIEADTAAATFNQSLNIKSISSYTSIATAQFEYRSSEKWLFGFGATRFGFAGNSLGAPWFTWARRW
jgi:hypothetical protein